MKKVITIAVFALVVVSFSSCKKDYTCACKGTEMGTLNVPVPKSTEKDAKTTCNAAETTYKNANATVTCELD